jgi:hypothetical protein
MKTNIIDSRIKESVDTILKNYYNESKLNQVLNFDVRKDFQWDAARIFLSEFEFEVYRNLTGLPSDRTRSSFSSKNIYELEEVVKNLAYSKTNFGRSIHTFSGENKMSLKPGPRSESFRYSGRQSYTGYNHFADYLFLCSREKPEILFSHEGLEKPVKILLDKTNNPAAELYYRLYDSQNYNNQVRVSSLKFKMGLIFWNENELAWQHGKELYHISTSYSERGLWIDRSKIEEYKNYIFSQFYQRRRLEVEQKKKIKGELQFKEIAGRVYVEYSDSISAGNCESQTRAFREQYKKIEGIDTDEFAVNGLYMLSIRDDSYTRRAIMQAAKRRNLI